MSVGEKVELTPEEFLALPDSKDYELVDGELRGRTMGWLSSFVAGRLHTRLGVFIDAHRLGWLFPPDNGFQCFPFSPKTVRKPDLSFIKLKRFAPAGGEDGWIKIVPDLVVEVVSPNDLGYEIEEKINEYLKVGVPLLWVIYPPTRTIHVIRGDGTMASLRERDTLSGEDVVPGFTCPVAELFLMADQ